MSKRYYIKASFTYPKSDETEQGGPGGIARFKDDLGGTVANIKALGCDGVIIGFNDVDPITPEDGDFIECVEAADMGLSVSVWHFPPSFASAVNFWDYNWHLQRATTINGFIGNIQFRFKRIIARIGDCEFYAGKHPYRADAAGAMVKDLPWTPHVAESLAYVLPADVYDEVWPIGKQHADAIGYRFQKMAPALIDWDVRYDAAGGAFQDPALTIPANPPANSYPGWFPATKPRTHTYWCNSGGTHVKAGTIYRKLWKPTDFADGVVYVDDRDQAAVIG